MSVDALPTAESFYLDLRNSPLNQFKGKDINKKKVSDTIYFIITWCMTWTNLKISKNKSFNAILSLNLNEQKLKWLLHNPENAYLRKTDEQNLLSKRDTQTYKKANDNLLSFSMVNLILLNFLIKKEYCTIDGWLNHNKYRPYIGYILNLVTNSTSHSSKYFLS